MRRAKRARDAPRSILKPSQPPRKRSARECAFYRMYGHCDFGAECRYFHDESSWKNDDLRLPPAARSPPSRRAPHRSPMQEFVLAVKNNHIDRAWMQLMYPLACHEPASQFKLTPNGEDVPEDKAHQALIFLRSRGKLTIDDLQYAEE